MPPRQFVSETPANARLSQSPQKTYARPDVRRTSGREPSATGKEQQPGQVSRPWADAAADVPNVTEREAAVLRQVARGRSNAEIAGALFLTEATVKTYVSRLLTKLNLRDRVQLAVLAYESGLVQAGDRGLDE